ncbi:MutS protein homolog, putative [Candida dubliniensis CD36]|uniref:DNA mismatch repair protein MSH3 n=1 Tax=Candida dubliniensis (strain CD36 / ATCC MYA-646 / CBS 7987 / NCPF 3949 / NRRL Y-17841) TaxID=573826 RepID=B9WCE2_CANDC|nr:MutS protein homolog, putative [Candida dubliniensis CD36]CAX44064.1 MutS protein homolog, putative [Candida dubliniensis CD36]
MSSQKRQSTLSRFFTTVKPTSQNTESTSTNNVPPPPSPPPQPPTRNEKLLEFGFNRIESSSTTNPTTKPKDIKKRKSTTLNVSSEPRIKKTMKEKRLTPLEKQILELTEQHQDKILLIQIGYKYKVFGINALKVSQILNIMYITNDIEDSRFHYCSIPDTRLHIHLQRILNHGYKVGIVKQIESSIIKQIEKTSKSSDVMRRELTRVYTKATYFGDELIGTNNKEEINWDLFSKLPEYIICINEISDKEFAFVAIQPLIGEIIFDCFKDDISRQELETRLLYLRPIEVIVITNEITKEISSPTLMTLKLINHNANIIHKMGQCNYEISDYLSNEQLVEYYSINFPLKIQQCFQYLLTYLHEFKLTNIFTIPENITSFQNSKKYMILPANTLNSLEIFINSTDHTTKGSLFNLLNNTKTIFGSRLLQKWVSRPLVHIQDIKDRHQAIDDLQSEYNHVVDSICNFLIKIKHYDLEGLLSKIHYSSSNDHGSNRASRKQVYLLLSYLQEILLLVKKFDKSIKSLKFKSSLLIKIFNELLSIAQTDIIIENFLSMIDLSFFDCKESSEQCQKFFKRNNFQSIEIQYNKISQYETLIEQELDIIRKELNNPKLKYVQKDGERYLIEIRNNQRDKIPIENYLLIKSTQTITRYRNKSVTKYLKLLQYHEEMLIKTCDEEFQNFLINLDSHYQLFYKIIKNLSIFDCLISLTTTSSLTNYTRPIIVEDLIIDVKKARNPIIEQMRPNYVSNDINIEYDKNRVLIITGPNMGGKSSYVKTVALLTVMTQIGCYLPCDKAIMGIFDSIFIRMGANDNILKGYSTFMMEMLQCKNIISMMTTRSLIILDEIGRGTGTIDGIALAYSILKYLIESEFKPLILFITHYPSIHVLEKEYPYQVINYHMGYQEIQQQNQNQNQNQKQIEIPEIIFLYNLCHGVVNNSYGLNVAKLAGISHDIIFQAFNISEQMKLDIEMKEYWKFAYKLHKVLKNELDIDYLFT